MRHIYDGRKPELAEHFVKPLDSLLDAERIGRPAVEVGPDSQAPLDLIPALRKKRHHKLTGVSFPP
ncbi:MAG: hypothetical protein ACYTA3_03930, partial [Planctomycetota bacterium]